VARQRSVTTLTDVARRAGVSVATASKALNNGEEVAPQTRQRVRQAADELSFSPNVLARGLISGRTGAIGLLTDELGGRFAIPLLLGIENALATREMSVLLCDARGDTIRRQHYIRALLARQVDGFIVLGDTNDVRSSLTAGIPVPVVYAYGESDHPDDLSVVADDVGGARLAAEHLVSLGRRHIGHITGEQTYRAARDRVTGLRQVLTEAGLPLVGDVPLYGEWTRRWGRHAARMLISAHPETDAIFCGSDQVANGAIEAILELGRRVPEDIAVVGYDNWEVFAADCRPPLTTVDLNLQMLGATAATHLLDALDGHTASGVVRQPGRLVIRESTGLAPHSPASQLASGGRRSSGIAAAVSQWVPDPLWEIAAPLLPPARTRPQGGGRRRAEDRAALAAILYVTSSGDSWRALPSDMFGVSRATGHRRFAEWRQSGTFRRLHEAARQRTADTDGSGWPRATLAAIAQLAGDADVAQG
jgi:LacI family transcriptional regulator